MFDTLLGAELPLGRMFITFLLVLALIGATVWAVRRFGGHRLGSAANRGRQPRLAVIDAAAVDTRRRLILIRRDNVEHLLMIGGPTDIVVEPNIVRAAAASRELGARTSATPERSAAAEATTWPLQPESITPRAPRAAEETWQGEPAGRQRPAESLLPIEPSRPSAEPVRPAAEPRSAAERKPEPLRMADPEPPRMAPPPAPAADIPVAADQNLAEMAQRLEAALRRPTASAAKPASAVDPEAKTDTVVSLAARGHSEAGPMAEKPGRAEVKAGRGEPKAGRGLYESLEQEMASLLSRPAARQ
jgi:flagellar protein FliO/FliZ